MFCSEPTAPLRCFGWSLKRRQDGHTVGHFLCRRSSGIWQDPFWSEETTQRMELCAGGTKDRHKLESIVGIWVSCYIWSADPDSFGKFKEIGFVVVWTFASATYSFFSHCCCGGLDVRVCQLYTTPIGTSVSWQLWRWLHLCSPRTFVGTRVKNVLQTWKSPMTRSNGWPT